MSIKNYFPVLDWVKTYNGTTFTSDLVAAAIVTIMLIPQSLAYALLAGLPAEVGLYASMAPLLLYAVFGSSRTLSVGPVAVVSLMTAAAIGNLGLTSIGDQILAASAFALCSGAFLVLMGLFRLGFVANFLSHPVIAGFITASGLIIAASQLKHLLGVTSHGHNLIQIASSLFTHLSETSFLTLIIGIPALLFLFWIRKGLKPLLRTIGLKERSADICAKAGPVLAIAVSTFAVWVFSLDKSGVAVIGVVPNGLPSLQVPLVGFELGKQLIVPAILISVIGFVESVSVGQTLAAKRRQRIDPDQELIGLGAANISSAISGGFPVTGGFSRSVVNYEAGAETPAAGVITALGIAFATLYLTPFLYFLPKAILAATIIVAVLSLIDFSIFRKTWAYSKADFTAVLITVLLTLGVGVEAGVSVGVLVSLLLYVFRTAKPHVAEVGQIAGSEHFRNINRHEVITSPEVVSLRVDGSLYFANARFLEDLIYSRVAASLDLKHVVLMCSAVNEIDSSALESLEVINQRLGDSGVTLHLSEVKGPVMDRLQHTHFLKQLSGKIFLSQYLAAQELKDKT